MRQRVLEHVRELGVPGLLVDELERAELRDQRRDALADLATRARSRSANSRPMTDAIWSARFGSSSSRSRRAIRTPWMLSGTATSASGRVTTTTVAVAPEHALLEQRFRHLLDEERVALRLAGDERELVGNRAAARMAPAIAAMSSPASACQHDATVIAAVAERLAYAGAVREDHAGFARRRRRRRGKPGTPRRPHRSSAGPRPASRAAVSRRRAA